MTIGYVGLGKMGKNMVLRMLDKKVDVVAWNRSEAPRNEVKKAGATVVDSVDKMIKKLPKQKIVWLMLPSGEVTTDMVKKLSGLLNKDDILIDGANSNFNDSIKHHKLLTEKGIVFLDVGVSGGPAGARNGACLMIGGDKTAYKQLEPLFKKIAAPKAYQFFPGAGAGHFVKMIHNGIEYGMMQAIAEGFTILKESQYDLDLEKVARIYGQQSVIESRLIDWTRKGYQQHGPDLQGISGKVDHKGEGKWTVETAQSLDIWTPIITRSLQFRIDSKNNPSYTGQVVSMLRNQFGGHEVTDEKLANKKKKKS